MKICFKCREEKPSKDFYKHPMMADGRLGKCKDCTKKDATATRLEKIAYYRSYDRARAALPHRKQLAKKIQERWKRLNPKKRHAQVMLGNAVKNGKVKPLPCFICGEKAEAHHPDYNAPLEVVWLCPPHHKQAHALARNT